jgi:hypothetical protein
LFVFRCPVLSPLSIFFSLSLSDSPRFRPRPLFLSVPPTNACDGWIGLNGRRRLCRFGEFPAFRRGADSGRRGGSAPRTSNSVRETGR